jgi:predicted dithiol-disulfide oxidoreductase (DUF899 family)
MIYYRSRLAAMSFRPAARLRGGEAGREAKMTEHKKIGTREEWLSARKDLLEREEEANRLTNELDALRRELPWVPIEKEHVFEMDAGTDPPTGLREGPGWNAFAFEHGVVHHTYSRHAPDGNVLAPYYYQLLDQVPKGRGEEFRAVRHDEYEIEP